MGIGSFVVTVQVVEHPHMIHHVVVVRKENPLDLIQGE